MAYKRTRISHGSRWSEVAREGTKEGIPPSPSSEVTEFPSTHRLPNKPSVATPFVLGPLVGFTSL
jgi:hypothetical protein